VPVRGRPSGRLASSADEYAEAMHELLALAKEPGARVAYAQLQRSAREAAARFSDDIFAEGFARALRPLFGAP